MTTRDDDHDDEGLGCFVSGLVAALFNFLLWAGVLWGLWWLAHRPGSCSSEPRSFCGRW